jgi:hypothetical protein
MGMRLGLVTETFSPAEDQSWLGSAHAVETAESVTLDADKFLTAFPTGIVPSGVVIAKITATSLYAPYTDAATHGAGTDAAAGHLLTTTDLHGTTAGTAVDTPVPYIWHGQVIEAKLPTNHGLTAAGKADMAGRIHYV